MAGWVALPVLPILAQSISHPLSPVPEHRTITEAGKELGFTGRRRAFATLLSAWGVPGKGLRQLVLGLSWITWPPLGLYA